MNKKKMITEFHTKKAVVTSGGPIHIQSALLLHDFVTCEKLFLVKLTPCAHTYFVHTHMHTHV